MKFKHYLLTRFNIDNIDVNWLENRDKLFRRFCLPSVLSQVNKNFEWILICDSRTPIDFKKRLDEYPNTKLYHNFQGHTKDASSKMDLAISLETLDYFLIDFIPHPLNFDFIITSRCDSDDAISKYFIERIQDYSKRFWKNQSFWLNLVRGYKFNSNKVYPVASNRNPFISFISSPNNFKTTFQICHTLAPKTKYKNISIREGQPTWMQVIHGANLLNKQMRFRGEKDFSTIKEDFKIN